MDDKIKQLIEVKKKYPDVFKIYKNVTENCPKYYGLNDHCEYDCLECWETAIEEVKDNAK